MVKLENKSSHFHRRYVCESNISVRLAKVKYETTLF